jgi:FKBP-type peptidyl-prolyl cis-trans isomerase
VSIESATFAPALGVNLAGSTKTASGLYYRDITVGTGTTVTAGKAVSVKYTGNLINGSQFDAGTFPLTVGAGTVIKGWDEGLVGMKVGGKRQLIIPPSLGYGSRDNGPIPANSILVFSVEVLSAQ